jgi:hypothetical protein
LTKTTDSAGRKEFDAQVRLVPDSSDTRKPPKGTGVLAMPPIKGILTLNGKTGPQPVKRANGCRSRDQQINWR